jgi:hypothetical protein
MTSAPQTLLNPALAKSLALEPAVFVAALPADLAAEANAPSAEIGTLAGPPAKRFVKTKAPAVKGKAKVGRTLKATVKRWSPAPSSFKYQWLRSGKKIAGATGATYKVRPADRGKRISVKVIASRDGLITTARVSAKTAKVK